MLLPLGGIMPTSCDTPDKVESVAGIFIRLRAAVEENFVR